MSFHAFEHKAGRGVRLFVRSWRPDRSTSCRGVVCLVHGMGEHSQRYGELGQYLSERGYAVYAPDLRGHGQTARLNHMPLGHLGDSDGFKQAASDLAGIVREIQEQMPQHPVVLVGHSMGSFLVSYCLQNERPRVDAAVLAGTGCPRSSVLAVGLVFMRSVAFVFSATAFNNLGQCFSSLKFWLQGDLSRHAWITRDKVIRQQFAADPLCGVRLSRRSWCDFLKRVRSALCVKSLALIDPSVPLLIIAGSDDAVGEFGSGVRRLVTRMGQAGLTPQLKFYEGVRHEAFNETNRREIYQDLLAWLERALAKTGA